MMDLCMNFRYLALIHVVQSSLKNWVTGFAKRKQQRREYGAIQLAKKQRIARNAARKERREALKITDRLTGAFGEKHKDDSDDELGEEGQNPEDFEKEQKEKKKAKPQQARHEDEEAVVTVVTREQNSSDEEMDDEEELDDLQDDEEEEEEEEEQDPRGRQGIPFRRKDDAELEAEAAAAAKSILASRSSSSSTAYNPSKSHQALAIQKAKLALKSKDRMMKKGIKGGHKFKKAKILSKKKKVALGKKKGAGRDK